MEYNITGKQTLYPETNEFKDDRAKDLNGLCPPNFNLITRIEFPEDLKKIPSFNRLATFQESLDFLEETKKKLDLVEKYKPKRTKHRRLNTNQEYMLGYDI